jgi:tRNA G46 methylase TrmB
MKTGVYVSKQTADLVVYFECPWDKKEHVIIIDNRIIRVPKNEQTIATLKNNLIYAGGYI